MASFSVNSSSIWNTTAGTKSCAGFSPVVNELSVLICAASGLTSTTQPNDSLDSTYYELIPGARALNNVSVDVIEMWIRKGRFRFTQGGLSNSPTSGQVGSTGGGLMDLHIAGLSRSGLGAIRQVNGVLQVAKVENQAAGTPVVTLPAAPLSSNMLIGAVLTISNVNTNCVPPAGWTERMDLGYNTPATGIEVATIDSGHSSATITWGGATPTGFAAIVIEVDASDPQIWVPFPIMPAIQPFGSGARLTPTLDGGTPAQNATATPSTVAATADVPAVTALAAAIATPSTVAEVAAVPAPTPAAAAISTPSTVVATGAVPAPTILASAVATPVTVAAVAAVAIVGTPITDTFTRADSGTLGNTETGGKTWVDYSGGWFTIASNHVGFPVDSSGIGRIAGFSVGVTDQDVQADLSPGSTVQSYVVARSTTGLESGAFLMAGFQSGGATTLNLYKVQAAGYTLVGSYAAGAHGGTVRMVVVGDDVKVYLDGTLRISYTIVDAAFRTGTIVGLYTSNIGATFDNFVVNASSLAILASAQATPATVVAVAAIPAPTVVATSPDVTTTPATVAAIASVPSPTVLAAAIASPATAAAVASIPSPSPSGTTLVTPSTVVAVASVPAPSPLAAATATPSTVAGVSSVPAPSPKATAVASPSTVAGVAAIPSPTVLGAVIASPTVVAAVAAVPSPSPSASAVVTPSQVAALVVVPSPSPAAGAIVSPDAVVATASVPSPTVLAGGAAVAQPNVVSVIAAVPSPSPFGDANANPNTVAATGAVPSPSPAASAVAAPGVVAAVGSVPSPNILTGGDAIAQPSTVVAFVSVPAAQALASAIASPNTVLAVATVPAALVSSGAVAIPDTVQVFVNVLTPTFGGIVVIGDVVEINDIVAQVMRATDASMGVTIGDEAIGRIDDE